MDKGKFLKDNDEVVVTGKAIKEYRDICKKEGAITELKATLITLNEMEAMHFSVKWWKKQIELRLKELEKGGKE